MRERDARNIGLFGAEGQHAVDVTSVGLIGYGGLGSHIGQQLAYLGSRDIVVVDGDIAEEKNLNRLIGATPADAEASTRKVDIADRVIRHINPEARVHSIYGALGEAEALEALARVDVIIGAVDNDPARLTVLELCSARGIPYIDAATDAGEFKPGPMWFGGRVYLGVGNGCLSCSDLLDQQALARAAMTPEQREADERIYGVNRALLGRTGPMVVSVNGVVASVAVTEFMALVTGLRTPQRHLVYRGESGVVVQNVDLPRDACFYCQQWSVARRERG